MTDVEKVMEELLGHPDFPEDECWRRVGCQAGDVVVREGDDSRDVYVIESGRVSVIGSVSLEQGRSVRPGIGELGPGQIFGEIINPAT